MKIVLLFLSMLIFGAAYASDKSEAHHIKDAPDCKEVIEHHCKAMDEKGTEACLVKWHEANKDTHELDNHKHCAVLIKILEDESH